MEDVCAFDYVSVIKTTNTQMLCEIDNEEIWIPRSKMLEGTDLEFEGDEGLLLIPRSLAEKRNLV